VPLVLVNPTIVHRGDETETSEEGCLSIPEIFGDVERPVSIIVEATNRSGASFRLETSGYQARAIQHEIDHLDGVLFLDHLSAVKRGLLLSKWKRLRKGETGFIKEVTPEPAGEL
jgi:peptide deformylase